MNSWISPLRGGTLWRKGVVATLQVCAVSLTATLGTLPLTAVPDVLKLTACNIARYRLYASQSVEASETVRNNYKDAVAWLRDVAAGRANLDPNASAAVPAGTGGPQYNKPDRVFNRDTLKDY